VRVSSNRSLPANPPANDFATGETRGSRKGPACACALARTRVSQAWCLFLLALVAVLPARAQQTDVRDSARALTQYKIDNWQTDQGLPLNTVQALLQTRDGHLWVGTGGGLARFDGVRFATFEASQVPELASRSIFGFLEDTGGNLWIGHSEGAAIYRDGGFRVAFGREVTDGRRVWGFAQGKDGAVWAATENGLVRWMNGATRVYRQVDGLPTDRLRSVAFDREGTLWIGTTGGGLVSFVSGRFQALTPENGFPHLAVRCVLADPAGGIWAATAGGGLAHVNRGRIRTFTTKDGLPTDQLVALSRDRHGAIWIATWGGGLSRMTGGRFDSISTENGLAGGQLWTVHADREGSIWAGTWVGGLNRLRTRDFVVLGTPEGLSHDNVRSVLHARDGVTWITTAGGGVNRLERGRITTIGVKQGLPSDETSCILEDRDGSIWIGTYTAGLARLTGGKVESWGTAGGLLSLDVRSLFQDRDGVVWAGTSAGLARFDGRVFVPVREPGAPMETITSFLQDRSGTMWFGTGEGLVTLRNGVYRTLTRKDGLLSNWIMHLHEDSSGTIWIATNGEGINRMRDGRLSAIRTRDGLWDGMGQVILEDRFANLWMTCNRGFYRVARSELNAFADGKSSRVSSIGFGPGDGLRSTTFAGGHQPAGAIDSDGKLWLPSFSGLVIVDPANLPGSGEPPAVRLEEVTVNGVPVSLGRPVVMPPGSVPLLIRYMTTSLRSADRVRFRYRMEGAGDLWVDAGARREAFYAALPHGRYRFRVAASEDGRTWREAASPLSIEVEPFLFQTRWFFPLLAVAILFGTAAVLRLRTRGLRLQKLEMERLVAEKTEELRLANEHLARLSFADSLTGLANRRRFDEAFEHEWQRALRAQTWLALAVVDVDLFKAYNDALGHPEGDKCLVAVAEVLVDAGSRVADVVARYGGEEFIVLLPGADHTAAVAFAERLRHACEARAIPHPTSSIAPVVTISIGVAACIPSDEMLSDVLMLAADGALYRAKRDGRNRVAS
jgi:diguanylate cyclase (GGDEF)-like protein